MEESIEENFFQFVKGEKIYDVIDFIKYKNWFINSTHKISLFFDENSNITHWKFINKRCEYFIYLNYFDINFENFTDKIKQEYKTYKKCKVYL